MLSSSLFSLLCVTLTLICGGSTEGQNNDLPVYPTVSPDPDIGSLYFGLLVGGSLENSSVLAAVRLSLDIINNRSDILSGYSLHYTLTYSGCSGSDLVDKTFTQLDGRPDGCKKLGLITAGCTSTSLVSSYVGNHFNVPEILCSQTVQSDARDLNMFRTHPSKLVLVPALVSIIASYEWTKVALMVENKQEYTPIIKVLKEEVMDLNITLSVTTMDLQGDSLKVIGSCGKDIFDSDVRIFILVMSSEMTRHLLCQAFKQSIKYPKHEFVLVSEQNSNWWVSSQSEDGRYGCSSNQRADVLSHSLGLQLNQDYIVRKQQAKYCYDAVWTLALALNKTVTEFGDIDCTYQDSQMNQLYSNIQKTDFIGKTDCSTNKSQPQLPDNHRMSVHLYFSVLVFYSINKHRCSTYGLLFSSWISGKWLFSCHGHHRCQTLENLLHFQESRVHQEESYYRLSTPYFHSLDGCFRDNHISRVCGCGDSCSRIRAGYSD
ncbi:gamma-aminobutyric acid type B receptor subunit 1-like isoform X2 [Halichondria panicea]|uniref:gamma-aminobutyric acid type B receptor subunit 1-like isoform X2 n=1 Tax=Halichondria panicea TaxID=6063 RepID=UPI00312B59D4